MLRRVKILHAQLRYFAVVRICATPLTPTDRPVQNWIEPQGVRQNNPPVGGKAGNRTLLTSSPTGANDLFVTDRVKHWVIGSSARLNVGEQVKYLFLRERIEEV